MKFSENQDRRDRRRRFFEADSLSRPQSVLNVGPELTPCPYLCRNCLTANWHRHRKIVSQTYAQHWKSSESSYTCFWSIILRPNLCCSCLSVLFAQLVPQTVFGGLSSWFLRRPACIYESKYSAQILVDTYCRCPSGRPNTEPKVYNNFGKVCKFTFFHSF